MSMAPWVVLLEAARGPDSAPVDAPDVRELLAELGGAVGLHCPDRYAVQLELAATNQAEALYSAMSRWDEAVVRRSLPRWRLVRTEVLTPEEFDVELDDKNGGGGMACVRMEGGRGGVSDGEGVARELLESAFRDPLTGLAGRDAFLDRIEQASTDTGRVPAPHAVVCLEIDDFGAVRSRLGHSAGDQVLVDVARRLVATLRAGDLLARVADHVFGIRLEHSSVHDAMVVSERLLEALRRLLVVGDRTVALTGSAGVAIAQKGEDPDVTLGQAERALGAAKESGGDRCRLFGPDTNRSARPRPDVRPDPGRDRLGYLLLMQQTALAANESASPEEAAKVVLRQVCAHAGWPVGHLWVVSSQWPDRLVSSGVWHLPANERYRPFQEATEATPLASGSGLPGAVMATGKPVWVPDLSIDRSFCRREAAARAHLRSGLAVPVLVVGEVGAVLEFFTNEPTEPDGSLLEVLAGVGVQLGRVVERSRAAEALRRSEERFLALVQART